MPRKICIADMPRPSYPPPRVTAREVMRTEGDPKSIVCRCEQVRKQIIVDVLTRPIPLFPLDAVKRRTRAGMELCQGTFCAPRVRAIIARRYKVDEYAVYKKASVIHKACAKHKRLSASQTSTSYFS